MDKAITLTGDKRRFILWMLQSLTGLDEGACRMVDHFLELFGLEKAITDAPSKYATSAVDLAVLQGLVNSFFANKLVPFEHARAAIRLYDLLIPPEGG